jgi:hypothetical protein
MRYEALPIIDEVMKKQPDFIFMLLSGRPFLSVSGL